ncbi:unnamed protein product, partial [Didymodactylos carnosus]
MKLTQLNSRNHYAFEIKNKHYIIELPDPTSDSNIQEKEIKKINKIRQTINTIEQRKIELEAEQKILFDKKNAYIEEKNRSSLYDINGVNQIDSLVEKGLKQLCKNINNETSRNEIISMINSGYSNEGCLLVVSIIENANFSKSKNTNDKKFQCQLVEMFLHKYDQILFGLNKDYCYDKRLFAFESLINDIEDDKAKHTDIENILAQHVNRQTFLNLTQNDDDDGYFNLNILNCFQLIDKNKLQLKMNKKFFTFKFIDELFNHLDDQFNNNDENTLNEFSIKVSHMDKNIEEENYDFSWATRKELDNKKQNLQQLYIFYRFKKFTYILKQFNNNLIMKHIENIESNLLNLITEFTFLIKIDMYRGHFE